MFSYIWPILTHSRIDLVAYESILSKYIHKTYMFIFCVVFSVISWCVHLYAVFSITFGECFVFFPHFCDPAPGLKTTRFQPHENQGKHLKLAFYEQECWACT